MKKFFRHITSWHLKPRFFAFGGLLVFVLALGFGVNILYPIGLGLLLLFALALLIELVLLYRIKSPCTAERSLGKMWSLGDDNLVRLKIQNNYPLRLHFMVYDEIPVQLQVRNFEMDFHLDPGEEQLLSYHLRPTLRGQYVFQDTNLHVSTALGFVSRHICIANKQEVPCFPSIVQMHKYELLAFAKTAHMEGIKKVRRLGHSYEFEQIKPYVQGDDVRSVNWKATGRRNQLMVNQYEDERSQQVYSIIDKSRNMYMPFGGLSLLDHAINTSLVLSNIVLKKHDKAGLISYSDTIGSTIRADRGPIQIKKILQALYQEKEQIKDANYDLLYRSIKNVVKTRSLLFLYLNFESEYALERALPVLQRINRMHLLVVMLFENTELEQMAHQRATFISEIYTHSVAQRLLFDKRSMAGKLRKSGIKTILTKPEDLSINTVNKYLELKAKGMI